MPEYKNIRLELRVYNELKKRMEPMESMSQIIKRLLNDLDEVRDGLERLTHIFTEGKQ